MPYALIPLAGLVGLYAGLLLAMLIGTLAELVLSVPAASWHRMAACVAAAGGFVGCMGGVVLARGVRADG